MFCCYRRKKFLPGCLIGLGLGIVFVLFLPLKAWLCMIGVCLIIGGISILFERWKGGINLTIVVKKVPKLFSGLVKFIFGIKDT